MTTLIIKSNSEEKTNWLLKFAREPGLDAATHDFRELDTEAMVKGIGRKATDEELIDYLSKDAGPFVGIEEAFAKYLDHSNSKVYVISKYIDITDPNPIANA